MGRVVEGLEAGHERKWTQRVTTETGHSCNVKRNRKEGGGVRNVKKKKKTTTLGFGNIRKIPAGQVVGGGGGGKEIAPTGAPNNTGKFPRERGQQSSSFHQELEVGGGLKKTQKGSSRLKQSIYGDGGMGQFEVNNEKSD